MKAGVYRVKGKNGPDKTEPVDVAVGDDGAGNWSASFVFRGESCLYRPRPMSPHPERVQPPRMAIGIQPMAKSVAAAAFKAAKEAVAAPVAAHSADDDDLDSIVMRGIARRTMGVAT